MKKIFLVIYILLGSVACGGGDGGGENVDGETAMRLLCENFCLVLRQVMIFG